VRRWIACLTAAAAVFLWSRPSGSTVRIDPHFQNLSVMGDRILLTSVDGRRLVCLSSDGKKLWERQFQERIVVGEYDKESLYVQDGTALLKVGLSAGILSPLGTLPAHQLLGWLPSEGLASSVDDRFDVRSFRMLDPKSLAPIWKTDNLESVVDIVQDTLVGVRAKRSYEKGGQGYSLSNATLVGLDRRSGALRWKVPLLNDQASSVSTARAGSLLVVIDDPFSGGRLFCLDPRDGRILSSLAAGDESGGRTFLEVSMDGPDVAYLESGDATSDAVLHFATLPDLKDTRTLKLVAKEILRFWLQGDFVLTAGIYDTASFDRKTGERYWEKGALGQWVGSGDRMLATDRTQDGNRARVITIGLRDGAVRELYSEAVSEQDRKDFSPW
jgi:PQQ-like domain